MAENRLFCLDPQPDLDNANVGNIFELLVQVCLDWHACILFIEQRQHVQTEFCMMKGRRTLCWENALKM